MSRPRATRGIGEVRDLDVGQLAIKVIIEFHAKAGARAQLAHLLADISATYGPKAPGFLDSTVYDASNA